MKAIYSVFFYISLAIALCSPNVSTLCGNNEQVEDLKTALVIHESAYTVMAALGAIPITSAPLIVIEVISAGHFAMRLIETFEEMENSLNKDHILYGNCSSILKKTVKATTGIKSAGVGFSLMALIPGFGMALAPPRIASSLYEMLIINENLDLWKKNDCQYATTRDCKL
ncbi:uncharacterized protein LOC107883183 [Acyrthosiphon pisum]|uniref:Uncharacterized protein n=1 Tax=Acyrthosiphon pisum TaxID=7029 RepID=A0A8R2D2I6_ACYPI|nr:uncharacterized protein LOC107883183 [Acyrthosiphon pisum]|eukprot:XP_016658241.1 PREDICTED: uncharacterized protein LOC107883183 [Acyrthosiphon pisum]